MSEPSSEPSNREAVKQEMLKKLGELKYGVPRSIWDNLPWRERFVVRWFDGEPEILARLPRDYWHACIEVARRLEDTTIWIPGPNVVTRTKARQG